MQQCHKGSDAVYMQTNTKKNTFRYKNPEKFFENMREKKRIETHYAHE